MGAYRAGACDSGRPELDRREPGQQNRSQFRRRDRSKAYEGYRGIVDVYLEASIIVTLLTNDALTGRICGHQACAMTSRPVSLGTR
jgi:hypothetical protein